MTAFKILFVGIMTFIHLANGTQHVVVPNASGGGRFVGTHHVESHTTYIGFKMTDYRRAEGWGAPTPFKIPVNVSELEFYKSVAYGMYALDGFTISVSHAPGAPTKNISHCNFIPHLTLECPSFSGINPAAEVNKDKNLVSADMVIDSGELSGRSTQFGARFSELDLNTPAADKEIIVTATSFDGSLVRRVYLAPGATIWFGNEWSGKFTNRKPSGENHWTLSYLLAKGSVPDCPTTPTVKPNCATDPPTPDGILTVMPAPARAYTISCSNTNYP